MATVNELELVDKKILNGIQGRFPLEERPFAAVGKKAGCSEEEAIARVVKLKQNRVIRQISAIFDSRALGYSSTLVATSIPKENEERGALTLNEHPGVSHNYRRNHVFNVWYTVTIPPDSALGLEKTVAIFHKLCGATSTRVLPTLKLFKIGVNLNIVEGEHASDDGFSDKERKKALEHSGLTEEDILLIRELQKDIPIVPSPYAEIAARAGTTTERLIERTKIFQEQGKMRRFAAVLNHRNAGFISNAMGVWDVPEERVLEVGPVMAAFPEVSHCYQRPTYPDWPYSIFTMVHAKSDEECKDILTRISEKTGVANYDALFSTREYKKVRVEYFTDDYAQWENKYKHLAEEALAALA